MVDVPRDWKPPKFTKEDNPHGLVAESSFSILFPKYRELYIRQNWAQITQILSQYDLVPDFDVLQGTLSVKTTNKTWDPYIIIKARDVLKLISRNVPYEQAVKVLEDDIVCDVIKIGTLVRKKERFVKRRQRLVGNNGSTLKALELLTGCYIMIHGNTVAAIGTYAGIKEVSCLIDDINKFLIKNVRRIVEDAMKNIHPIYNIKTLMIKKELMKDERLKGESWDRFLPKFKNNQKKGKKKNTSISTNTSNEVGPSFKQATSNAETTNPQKLKNEGERASKKRKFKQKKEYTPFPPLPVESKIDKEIETGEYFLKDSIKKRKELFEKKNKQVLATEQKLKKKMKIFEPPVEDNPKPKKLDANTTDLDIKKLKKKLKKIT